MSILERSKYPNVSFVKSTKDIFQALDKLSIQPRVKTTSQSTSAAKDLYTVWRSTSDSDYLFLYDKGPSATFDVAAEVWENKAPYQLNAWTGQQEAIAVCQRLSPDTKDGISVVVADAQEASLTLSNGRTKRIPALKDSEKKKLLNVDIGKWNLTLESWVPGPDETKSTSAKKMLHLGTQTTLQPWSQIPVVQNASGVGTYTANFQLRIPSKDTITVLQFGPVLNTMRAWINGTQLQAIDIFDPQIDISSFLVSGSNLIRIEVASTLFNAVKARVDYVKTNGVGPAAPPLYTAMDWQQHGLVGPVIVKSLRRVDL
ncbi:hypothetical protein QL093DRAFT_2539193 [Fusarium oxysporum]|nr:hypothetical protein QL093DRAFT_2539193 [Fusarium oxysporum]